MTGIFVVCDEVSEIGGCEEGALGCKLSDVFAAFGAAICLMNLTAVLCPLGIKTGIDSRSSG